ncbi:MAG TPA: hypothetical protein VKX35_02740 [Fermentimonas sp.]|nr:hypothetical protein [Fermentimonas sp.]
MARWLCRTKGVAQFVRRDGSKTPYRWLYLTVVFIRMIKGVYDEEIIKKISDLRHETGYHYETMDSCKGDVDEAYQLFCKNLEKLREIVPVKTICMHGSPLSKYDNRDIWAKYDYKELGIIGEPYFDVDYDKVLYLTDTGRGWNNRDASIRDRVNQGFDLRVKTTFDLLEKIKEGKLPERVIINTHPQRWGEEFFPWVKELIFQRVKNTIKWVIVKLR